MQFKASISFRKVHLVSRALPRSMSKRLLALDFDGVVCDSCGESSMSAWKSACILWPDVFKTSSAQERKDGILEKMRVVRPVVETGYENIVQVRALFEGTEVNDILAHWHELLPKFMSEWGVERSQLVNTFGSTRDQWMAEDLQGWLAPNKIYPGIDVALKAAIASSSYEVYIVTTKQARFTKAILQQMAGIDFAMDRIFSQTISGQPKTEVLTALQDKHSNCSHFIFVEDKLATLCKVIDDDRLRAYELFLVDWGYNTEDERKFAQRSNRVNLVSVDQFAELLSPS